MHANAFKCRSAGSQSSMHWSEKPLSDLRADAYTHSLAFPPVFPMEVNAYSYLKQERSPLHSYTNTHTHSGGGTPFGSHTFGDQQVLARKVVFWVLSIDIRKELSGRSVYLGSL